MLKYQIGEKLAVETGIIDLHKVRESNIQSLLSKKLSSMDLPSMAYELKLTKTSRLPFSSIYTHQLDNLLKVKTGVFHYKNPDMSASNGFAAQKPFDGFILAHSPAFLAVCFYQPRQKKQVYFIDIENFLQYMPNKKSLKKSDVSALTNFVVDI